MEVKVGGSKQKVRHVEPKTLLGYIEQSGIKWGGSGTSMSGSQRRGTQSYSKSGRASSSGSVMEFLVDRWWIHNVKFKHADNRLLESLSQEMGRTRTLERSINNHLPNKLEELYNKRESLDKKSSHYKRSYQSVMNQIKDNKLKLKEYKYEWKFRKRLVYTLSSSIIPALYIIRREKYNVVQCKWRFMGKEQSRIHLGTYKDVGDWDDDKLRKVAIRYIQNKFTQPLDSITKGWIDSENTKLDKWCSDMNYRVRKD